MTHITVDFGPPQIPITKERIQEMLTWIPRRFRLADCEQPLKPPGDFGKDWNILFPFQETFVNAFETSCVVDHIPFTSKKGPSCYTFLKNATEEEIEEVKEWFVAVSPYVALRDCLALSFALDYDRTGGNPDKPQTKIGILRSRAKSYKNIKSTKDMLDAADELIQTCLDFRGKVDCYESAEVVIAMPSSEPGKPFELPKHLAAGISEGWGKPFLKDAVRTIKARAPLKDSKLSNKLKTIEGTIEVDPKAVKDKVVLLVDDLYQSGVSINYVGMLLLEAGARKVFGLACEKTCSNDDNVSRRESR